MCRSQKSHTCACRCMYSRFSSHCLLHSLSLLFHAYATFSAKKNTANSFVHNPVGYLVADKAGDSKSPLMALPGLNFLRLSRSEERRVGKECSFRWSRYEYRKRT